MKQGTTNRDFDVTFVPLHNTADWRATHLPALDYLAGQRCGLSKNGENDIFGSLHNTADSRTVA